MSHLEFPNLSSVAIDDAEACRCAIDKLIGKGHRKIVVVGGERVISDTGRSRYEGCLASLQAHGISFDEELDYRAVRFSYEGGYRGTMDLIESGREFTALFAAADVMAIGAIRALRDKGLRVPEDVSVTGFDGLRVGAYLVPKLSTVAQPAQQMGKRSVEILIACIEDGAPAVHETVPFALLERGSVAPIKQ